MTGSLRRRRTRGLGALAAALLALAALAGPATAAPEQASMGLYLSGVHGLDFVSSKFTADFWIWSTIESDHLSPVESAFIVNEVTKDVEQVPAIKSANKKWEQRRVRADLWAHWQVGRFPFDSQVLTIVLEESRATTDELVYMIDRKNSGIDHELRIPGWTITGWSIEADEHRYESNFGDPANAKGISSARLVFTLSIQREGLPLFIDMTIGAFLAFGILSLTFRLNPTVPPVFGARMVITAACIFTVMISMRAYSSSYSFQLGETLTNRVHLVTFVAGFIAAFAGAIARYYVETGREAVGLRCDRWGLPMFVGAYVAIVGAMVGDALLFH